MDSPQSKIWGKIEEAIDFCASQKFQKKFWKSHHVDKGDSKKFLKALKINLSPSENDEYEVSIEDFYEVRVYPLEAVKKGVASGAGMGVVIGAGTGVTTGASIGSVIPVAGTIAGGIIGGAIGVFGGAVAGIAAAAAAGAAVGAARAFDKRAVITVKEIFGKFSKYSYREEEKRHYCYIIM